MKKLLVLALLATLSLTVAACGGDSTTPEASPSPASPSPSPS